MKCLVQLQTCSSHDIKPWWDPIIERPWKRPWKKSSTPRRGNGDREITFLKSKVETLEILHFYCWFSSGLSNWFDVNLKTYMGLVLENVGKTASFIIMFFTKIAILGYTPCSDTSTCWSTCRRHISVSINLGVSENMAMRLYHDVYPKNCHYLDQKKKEKASGKKKRKKNIWNLGSSQHVPT